MSCAATMAPGANVLEIALSARPALGAVYGDGRFEFYARVNVSAAIATANALVVPTKFDADSTRLATILAAPPGRTLSQESARIPER
jgi:hypothetical protein